MSNSNPSPTAPRSVANTLFGRHKKWIGWLLAILAIAWLVNRGRLEHSPPPPGWFDTTKVPGQDLPVPKQWLQSEEGKIAHSLVPPPVVPKPVPFNFTQAWLASRVPFSHDVSHRYWEHLCATEAGEWFIKTVDGVEGLYFPRPVPRPTWPEQLTDLYLLEAPTIDSVYYSSFFDDTKSIALEFRGGVFVSWPDKSYSFVEEPHRNVPWQEDINEPYIRMFGYRNDSHEKEWKIDKETGKEVRERIPGTPMRVAGIPAPTAQYAYAWRGLMRERDRELGISGIEYLIYDRETKEILSFRRTFLLAAPNPDHTTRRAWLQGSYCREASVTPSVSEYIASQALRTLKTKEPSNAPIYDFDLRKK